MEEEQDERAFHLGVFILIEDLEISLLLEAAENFLQNGPSENELKMFIHLISVSYHHQFKRPLSRPIPLRHTRSLRPRIKCHHQQRI